MSGPMKGVIVCGSTTLVVTVLWACIAGGHPAAIGEAECDPIYATQIVGFGLFAGLMTSLFGIYIGQVAARLRRGRRVVLGAIAFGLAAMLCLPFLSSECPTSPSTAAVEASAIVPALIAAIVLEWWTRPTKQLAAARAR
jgi:hypothetical protein